MQGFTMQGFTSDYFLGFTTDCVVLLHYVFGFVSAVFFIADVPFHFVLLLAGARLAVWLT